MTLGRLKGRLFSLTLLTLCPFSLGYGQNLNSQTLDFQMRQGEPHPWQSTAYPEDQFIAAIGVDGAPVKITGEMLTACDGACFTVKPRAGEQASELAVSFAGHGAELLKPGVHSASIEIGSRRWTVRLNVLRRYPYLPFFYRAGYPTGCHNSDVHMQYEDTCVISNEQPADKIGRAHV